MSTECILHAASQPIAIIGATGTQGRSVLAALLETEHPVYALTRSPAKLHDLSIAHQSLKVIETDIADPGSLRSGLVGVWALFVNTLSDYSKLEGTEEAMLRGIVDAAYESGVEWLVLSALPEGVPARAYEEKARAMKYARETAGKGKIKPIFVHVGLFPLLRLSELMILHRWDGT